MKNIAILIGVTEYKNKERNLPVCKNDVENMYKIISASSKYEIIEVIKGSCTSSEIRNKIMKIEKDIDKEEIGELFFYFSGHGYSSSGNFYFCASDTDIVDINSTGIIYNQIDDIIRKINPKLYVKVIDACQSSTYYIKDFSSEEKNINDCYFMFSSKQTQSSWTGKYMSDFTKFYIEAIIKNQESQSIKYIDICNYLADQFKKTIQTPEFVTQGDMLGEFIEYNSKVKKCLIEIQKELEENIENNKKIEELPLKEIIHTKIQKLATQDMYKEFMKLLNENIKSIQIYNEDLKVEFDLVVEYNSNINDIVDKAIIANWVYENKEKYNLFANSNIGFLRSTLAYNLRRTLGTINGQNEVVNLEKVTITENEFPCHYMIEYIPKEFGLEKYCIDLVIISSPYKIYLFFMNIIQSLASWNSYEMKVSSEWKKYEIEIKNKDQIRNVISEYINSFEDYVIKSINDYIDNLEN